jgi:thiamine phosphate synthase YjbQ (UPF0047 family)
MSKISILVVEDEAIVAKDIQNSLKKLSKDKKSLRKSK